MHDFDTKQAYLRERDKKSIIMNNAKQNSQLIPQGNKHGSILPKFENHISCGYYLNDFLKFYKDLFKNI